MRGRARRRVGSELQAGRLWLTSGKGSCRGELGRGRSADRTGSKTCRADASICGTCASFGRVGLVATLAVSPFTFPSEAGRGVDGLRGRATGWPAAKPHAAFASASGFGQLFAFLPFTLRGTARAFGAYCNLHALICAKFRQDRVLFVIVTDELR
jgi:hypothetical protein